LQPQLGTQSGVAQAFASGVERLLDAVRAAQKPDQALKELEGRLKALTEAAGDKPSSELAKAIATLSARRIETLAAAGKMDEARTLLDSALAEADAELAKNSDDTAAIVRKIGLLRSRQQLADAGPGADEA